jgi:hypothetical protein
LGVASKPPHASLVQGDFNIKLEIAWVNSWATMTSMKMPVSFHL